MRIIFESGPLEAVEDLDPDLPSDVPAYSSVTFSTGVSWQRVAEDYAKIVDAQLAAGDLKSLVEHVIARQKSRDQKISAILQYLDREVRYTGVEFAEATIVPRSPSETLTRKYGDCKDKAALLVGMLRAAGIPAYVALLNAGSREDVSADLPGLGMFDHAIVYVPGSPDFWVDATDEYARLGEMPSNDQGRLALIARPETTSLSLTPVASSSDNTIVEKREVSLAENGPARIVETSQPHGSAESSYRRAYADKENKNAKEELTNYVKSQYLAEKLDRMDRSDPRDLSQQFELVLESDHSKRGATDLDIAVAAIRIEALLNRLPADLRQREKVEDPKTTKTPTAEPKKPRTSDYQLPIAFVTEWRYTITPPPGFQPRPLPQNVDLPLGPAKLTEQNIYDSILVHGSTYSWATKYQFIKNYYDNPILVGIGEYFIKINSWGRFEKGFSGKYGFVDSMGRIIIPMTFDFAEPFKEGLAIVKIQDKYGFINQQGEIVIPAKYDEAESFCEGFAVVCIGKWVTEIDDRKYGFINKKGQEVIPIQFKYASSFSKGFGGVLQNDTLFPVDTSGRINYNSTKK